MKGRNLLENFNKDLVKRRLYPSYFVNYKEKWRLWFTLPFLCRSLLFRSLFGLVGFAWSAESLALLESWKSEKKMAFQCVYQITSRLRKKWKQNKIRQEQKQKHTKRVQRAKSKIEASSFEFRFSVKTENGIRTSMAYSCFPWNLFFSTSWTELGGAVCSGKGGNRRKRKKTKFDFRYCVLTVFCLNGARHACNIGKEMHII